MLLSMRWPLHQSLRLNDRNSVLSGLRAFMAELQQWGSTAYYNSEPLHFRDSGTVILFISYLALNIRDSRLLGSGALCFME